MALSFNNVDMQQMALLVQWHGVEERALPCAGVPPACYRYECPMTVVTLERTLVAAGVVRMSLAGPTWRLVFRYVGAATVLQCVDHADGFVRDLVAVKMSQD
ncbi:hypothetical protein [Falsiroseomonas selenitidurans]|uniref:Uncharacterized protein n=1 Tax=Falsiroseomonas selenitidurans TaxID=2716335 RepID=A0ABX1E6C5_9PROT|nr:hypothetical protein [Falsiroseomonas selenitidurans]NKC32295.1 hypothetical protein [Falsiroseomonas selenitidurans]